MRLGDLHAEEIRETRIRVIGEGAATAGVDDETGEVAGDVSAWRIAV